MLNPRQIVIILLAFPIMGLFFFYLSQNAAMRDQEPAQDPGVTVVIDNPNQGKQLQNFELRSHQGRLTTLEDLKGKPWIAYFFYTRCPGPCLSVNKQIQGLQVLKNQYPDLQFVGFSVDPGFDTPEELVEYRKRHSFSGEDWTMLTGDRETIYSLAHDGFVLPVGEAPPDMASQTGPIFHSEKIVLVDEEGRTMKWMDSLVDELPAKVAAAIEEMKTIEATGGSSRSADTASRG